MTRGVLALLLFVCALVGGGCAAERKETPATAPLHPTEATPPGPERHEAAALDALERDLQVSESRLLAELERRRVESRTPISDDASKGGQGSPARKKKEEAGADAAAEERALDTSASPRETPCELACRALASMQRAARGICSVTGVSDPRCASAEARVEQSARRIAEAGCACRPLP